MLYLLWQFLMNEYNQYITKYSILCVLFQAANYLNIEGSLELTCQNSCGYDERLYLWRRGGSLTRKCMGFCVNMTCFFFSFFVSVYRISWKSLVFAEHQVSWFKLHLDVIERWYHLVFLFINYLFLAAFSFHISAVNVSSNKELKPSYKFASFCYRSTWIHHKNHIFL